MPSSAAARTSTTTIRLVDIQYTRIKLEGTPADQSTECDREHDLREKIIHREQEQELEVSLDFFNADLDLKFCLLYAVLVRRGGGEGWKMNFWTFFRNREKKNENCTSRIYRKNFLLTVINYHVFSWTRSGLRSSEAEEPSDSGSEWGGTMCHNSLGARVHFLWIHMIPGWACYRFCREFWILGPHASYIVSVIFPFPIPGSPSSLSSFFYFFLLP
ncbi:hypothetical protein KQX54_007791 [Cotesia glomerata]|uniref:Uncharacterized protein n=1 Tax=Cotesia glomerata TaxID=32391 RepID=A0AAV7IVD9_COTGL|nr:hypothetical protein KQX54_007791 [Cotesia glomerata]